MFFPRCSFPIGIFPDKNKPINPVLVPCGRCTACRIRRANTWALRSLMEYYSQGKVGVFLTLTYDDEYLVPSLSKEVFQNFLKRFRNDVGKFRYFGCGEYGEKFGRPHYHFLIFGLSDTHDVFCNVREFLPNGRRGFIRAWRNGFVHVGYISEQSCLYVAKYMLKAMKYDGVEPPFQLMSRRPALGDDYMRNHYDRLLYGRDPVIRFCCTDETIYNPLPRFVRERCELYERLASDDGISCLAKQELYKDRRIAFANKQLIRDDDVRDYEVGFQQEANLKSLKKRGVL